MVDMGTAVWRGVADFGNLFKNQKAAGAGFDELGRKSDQNATKGASFGSKVTDGLGKIGPKAKDAGNKMTLGLTLPIVGMGVKAVQSFSDFEQSITQAGAKTNATSAQIAQMRDLALEMGAKTNFSAGEAATAMDNMAAAGFDAKGVMAALPGVLLAAQASGEDLGMTADITAKAINAFNLQASDASHVADVFATAANTSAIDMLGLGQALAHAGQLGSSANQDLEDVVAVLGRLVDMGVPAASAGAGLRQALQSLKSPTTKARGYIADLGLSFRDVHGQMLPLPDLLQNLSQGLSTSNPKFVVAARSAGVTQNAYRDMAMQALFGVEGQQAMNLAMAQGKPVLIDTAKETEKMAQLQKGLAVTLGKDGAAAWIKAHTKMGQFSASGADAVRALGALNRASDGTSKKIGAIVTDTTKGRLDALGGSIETLAITLVTIAEPALTSIVKWLTKAANTFASWAKAHPTLAKIVLVLLAILAVAGPLLVAFGMVAGAITAIAALGAPVILVILAVIAAIGALIVIGVLLYKNWGKIKSFLISVWNAISGAAVTAWGAIGAFFVGIWNWIKQQAQSIWSGITSFFSSVWSGITGVVTTVWNGIVGFLVGVWNRITGVIGAAVGLVRSVIQAGLAVLGAIWSAFWNTFGGLITAVWNLIVAVVRLYLTIVFGIINTIGATIVAAWRAIWGAVSAAASAVWKAISGAASAAWNAILGVLKAIWGAIVRAASAAWNAIKTGAQSVWNAIKSAAVASWNAIVGAITSIVRAIWGKISGPLTTVKNGVQGVWNTVSGAAQAAWNGIVNWVSTKVNQLGSIASTIKNKIVGAVSGAGSWLLDSGKKIIQGLIDGITSKINDLTGVINGITSKISNFFPHSPVKEGPLRVLNRGRVGRTIMEMIASGISRGTGKVQKVLKTSALKISPMIDSTVGLPPGARPPGAPPASGGVSVPRLRREDGSGGGNTYNVTAINPVGETTAESVSKAVTRLAALGVAS